MSGIKLMVLVSLSLVTQSLSKPCSNYNCTCAAMEEKEYKDNNPIPLVESAIMHILPECGEEGNEMCKKLCINLAKVAQADPEGGKSFCQKVNKDISNINISVFSKACDNDYIYTGLTFERPTCCIGGVPCAMSTTSAL